MIDTGQYGATAPVSGKEAQQRAFDNHRARIKKLKEDESNKD